jgi:hypothetical protein
MKDCAPDKLPPLTGPAERRRVLSALRAHETELRRRGVRQLYLYGLTARGDPGAASDVDLYAAPEAGARWNLLTLASLTVLLEGILGRPVDFADVDSLKPSMRAAAGWEAIEVIG